MAAPKWPKEDNLSLTDNNHIIKLLFTQGENEPDKEEVIFSDFVIKINKRDKEQTRALLVTNKAVYNLAPKKDYKCKRRIPITAIDSITASKLTDEFVIHVTNEYDYRFKSPAKKKICDLLRGLYSHLHQKKLEAHTVALKDLKDVALTKAMARMKQREDILKKRAELINEDEHDSDDEKPPETRPESESNADNKTIQLLENSEQVSAENFEMLKVLGRGVSGKVMLAKKKDNQKLYAMKIMKKSSIIKTNQVEHISAERKILEALQHPFLMTLRYAFQTKDKLYFVLDYFPGGELFFHLKRKRRFSEAVAQIYVAEIAAALGHLHTKGIIYRDLKPENILLDEHGHVCLTDFGLSKDIKPDEQAFTFCGTPEYLAPEIITGAGHGKAVDWWSLGILLYELTVGIPPFYSQNPNEMYQKIQTGVLRFPPFLTVECRNIIVELLNRNPAKRLGAHNDVDDIKQHAFFKNIEWDKLMNKEYDVAYKPVVDTSQPDTSNFDVMFTAEPVNDSPSQGGPQETVDDNALTAFDDFAYVPKEDHKDNSRSPRGDSSAKSPRPAGP